MTWVRLNNRYRVPPGCTWFSMVWWEGRRIWSNAEGMYGVVDRNLETIVPPVLPVRLSPFFHGLVDFRTRYRGPILKVDLSGLILEGPGEGVA